MLKRIAQVAAVLLASVAAMPAHAGSDPASSDCVWGQKGYRDCVDRLLAGQRSLDPDKALRDTERRTRQSSPGSKASPGTPARPSGRRPGAGSLTPTAPAELRITPPTYDPAQEAVASERRQRDLDNNLYRMQRDAVTPPIMPPVLNPSFGRICPAGGC